MFSLLNLRCRFWQFLSQYYCWRLKSSYFKVHQVVRSSSSTIDLFKISLCSFPVSLNYIVKRHAFHVPHPLTMVYIFHMYVLTKADLNTYHAVSIHKGAMYATSKFGKAKPISIFIQPMNLQ